MWKYFIEIMIIFPSGPVTCQAGTFCQCHHNVSQITTASPARYVIEILAQRNLSLVEFFSLEQSLCSLTDFLVFCARCHIKLEKQTTGPYIFILFLYRPMFKHSVQVLQQINFKAVTLRTFI